MNETVQLLEYRLKWAFGLLLLGLLALLVRTGYVQIFRSDELAERARNQHLERIRVDAPRGRIFDRDGRILAGSYHGFTVAADPQLVDDPGAFASAVAFRLGDLDAADDFIESFRRGKRAGRRYVLLRRRVDRDVAESLRAAGLEGLDLREEETRFHPHGDTAIQVLGLFGGAGDPDKRIGLSGLEARYDDFLHGIPGFRPAVMLLHRDEQGGGIRRKKFYIYPERGRRPVRGLDVHTTLSLPVQQIAEAALDELQEKFAPKRSCALAMDPRTGEILAMAGRPRLKLENLPDVLAESLKIQAVEWSFEPGSTIKPLILAAALSVGAVRPGQIIDCGPGYKRFGARLLHDVHAYHELPIEEVLVKSSNIGMAQVAQALGSPRTHGFLAALGFGRRTGIQLSGEAAGKLWPLKTWKDNYALVSAGIGYQIQVTPLQLIRAYSALLNGGIVRAPRLVRDGLPRAESDLDLTGMECRFVRDAMVRVVEEGTGRRARVKGLKIGGKTGTSKKYPLESKRYVATFLGFAPADDPQIVVLVAADEPTRSDGGIPYGGVVAAPYVGQILRRAQPLLDFDAQGKEALSRSGVRHEGINAELVRVAAVK